MCIYFCVFVVLAVFAEWHPDTFLRHHLGKTSDRGEEERLHFQWTRTVLID